jgi:hypothetical protein
MMKTLKFLIFAALALGMTAACSTDYPSEEGLDLMTLHLSGTKWQLEDIHNLKTGKSRILEPLPSTNPNYERECYTFTFRDDTIAYGRSCVNALYVNVKGPEGAYLGCMTEVGEPKGDCHYFSDVLRLVDNCFYEKERLIFAYTQDGVRYHLRFKEVIPSAIYPPVP